MKLGVLLPSKVGALIWCDEYIKTNEYNNTLEKELLPTIDLMFSSVNWAGIIF